MPFREVRTRVVFTGKDGNSLECAIGPLCVAELLRNGLKVLWDTAILRYLVMYVVLKDSLGCCSLGIIHIDFQTKPLIGLKLTK